MSTMVSNSSGKTIEYISFLVHMCERRDGQVALHDHNGHKRIGVGGLGGPGTLSLVLAFRGKTLRTQMNEFAEFEFKHKDTWIRWLQRKSKVERKRKRN